MKDRRCLEEDLGCICIVRVDPWHADLLLTSDTLAEYMATHLDIPEEEVSDLCTKLYKEYGTTVAGLVVRPLSLSKRMLLMAAPTRTCSGHCYPQASIRVQGLHAKPCGELVSWEPTTKFTHIFYLRNEAVSPHKHSPSDTEYQ